MGVVWCEGRRSAKGLVCGVWCVQCGICEACDAARGIGRAVCDVVRQVRGVGCVAGGLPGAGMCVGCGVCPMVCNACRCGCALCGSVGRGPRGSCGLSCRVCGVRGVGCALRGEGCRVRGVWCGEWCGEGCVVRGAWCAACGARCVVRCAWCVVRGAWCEVWSQISTRSRTSAALDFDGFGGCRGSPSFRIGDLDGI
jgi:hypothetical protein